MEFLGDTRVGCRTATRVIGPREEAGQESEGDEGGGQARPRLYFPLSFSYVLFLCYIYPFLSFGGTEMKEIKVP